MQVVFRTGRQRTTGHHTYNSTETML